MYSDDRKRREVELVVCALWSSALLIGFAGNAGMKPALYGAIFSNSNAFEDGEPMLGVAASALYLWLTAEKALALPVFICALLYIPYKTTTLNRAPRRTLASITTLVVVVYFMVLSAIEEYHGFVPHPLMKFFGGLPSLFASFFKKYDGSIEAYVLIFARSCVTAFVTSTIPLSPSHDGQICVFYLTCVAILATLYDLLDMRAAWWKRQMKLVVARL